MYVKALSIDPESQLAHYNLGVAFADAGIYKEAIREWNAVVAAGPSTDAARQAQDNIRVLRNLMRQPQ
jgi:cytochrome c-type biogenesis protein CcmH/NrfG